MPFKRNNLGAEYVGVDLSETSEACRIENYNVEFGVNDGGR